MQDYYVGLDMGTNSVGWAVTDENYKLLRFKGKDMWGIREFEEADTAVARRTNRTARRRRQRNKVYKGLLRDYFCDAINEVDKDFFSRLDNSKYFLEDKDDSVKTKNVIFDDSDYNDADYYKEYPTIFHLRKELMKNESAHDVRLVYLALANMFKHRGHFLNMGLSADNDETDIETSYYTFKNNLENYEVFFPSDIDIKEFERILSSREYNRTKKSEYIAQLLGIEKKQKRETAFVKLLTGLKVDGKILFPDIQNEEKIEICFSDMGYSDKESEIISLLGEENYTVIENAKQIFDIGSLAGILRGYATLSEARVEDYKKHHLDLKRLQKVIKRYGTAEDYNKMFRLEEDGSYSAYVKSVNSDSNRGKTRRNMSNRKQADFYDKVKKLLKNYPEDEDVKLILAEIDCEAFMPKQLTAMNGVIPNQVHLREMKKILANAENYLPFLNEKDESGLTVSERILKLFSFRIPYYIGPVSEKSAQNGGNGWVVRKEQGQVLPWNITEKIDIEKTSEKFIERLIRNCTYISGEKVLPKNALIYERYCVLNEINNICVDGERISPDLKQDIYRELFESGKRVTKKKISQYLMKRGIIDSENQISGVDININSSLSSYAKFYAVFGEDMKKDSTKQMVEEIIKFGVIYGDDRKRLKDKIVKILETYNVDISDKDIKRILGYKFKDWGRLSKEFLELQGVDKNTGEIMSLTKALWETSYNMMELIHSDKYTFGENLKEKQVTSLKSLSEFQYEDMDEMYFSAPVKRMLWQTILLLREIERIMGAAPKRIFIEMTRSEQEKGDAGRKASRGKVLTDLYKSINDDLHSKAEWKELIQKEEQSGRLRSKKMYLYCRQMGRSAYTGKPIDLDELFNDNKYDIDHIYPRHFVKDDNIENNLVLVEKEINNVKSDTYPVDKNIRDNVNVRKLWDMLHENKLMNDEKYRRLTGSNPFSEEQMAGFIARQLVETSQGTKGAADIIKQLLPDTKIVYSKASNVSDFRRIFDIPKSRLVNDFHHAHDAYLNIVVGNTYFTKFTDNPLNFIRKEYKNNHYNLDKMFEWDVVRNGYTAWKASDKKDSGTIKTVKKSLERNTPILTRWSFEKNGKLADATVYSARRAKNLVYLPLKTSDKKLQNVTRYGGVTNARTAYFFIVEHEVKKKRIRTIETVPVYLKDKVEKNENALMEYCTDVLQLVNPDIRLNKIKLQSLIKKDGYFLHISGKSNSQILLRNAVNLCLKSEWTAYIKLIEKYIESGILTTSGRNEKIYLSTEKNIELYDILIEKHKDGIYKKRPNFVGEKLEKGREKYIELSLEEQCKILSEILKLSVIGVTIADLKLIGASSSSGKMLISNNISGCSEIKLINQSVTGLYENSIDLLTV